PARLGAAPPLKPPPGPARPPLAAKDHAEPEIGPHATGVCPHRLAIRLLGLAVTALPGPHLGALAEGFGAGHFYSGRTAIASISTSRSSRTRREISTRVLAGRR